MSEPPKDMRPKRHVDAAEIASRLTRCEGVARSSTCTDDDLRRFLDRLRPLDGDAQIRSNANVSVHARRGGPLVATIHVEVDEACTTIPVLDIDGIRTILEHALATPPMRKADMERLLVVRAFAGDVDGRRAGATSLGIAGGTPWSDPAIAGHGMGWEVSDGLDYTADDLPYVHVVRLRGDGLTLEQCVVYDSPSRIEIDPMTMLRVMAESTARTDAMPEGPSR